MEMWQVWLLVKLDSITETINAMMWVMLACGGIFAIFAPLIICECGGFSSDTGKSIVRIATRLFLPTLLFVVVCRSIVPTTKEAAVIIAVPAIMDSRVVKDDIPEVYDLAVQWAKEKLGKPANVEAP